MLTDIYPFNLAKNLFDTESEAINISIAGLKESLLTLTEREQAVLKYRFEDHKTLREVGAIYGITQERIRQIEAKALRKLRCPTRKNNIRVVSMARYKALETEFNKVNDDYNTLLDAYSRIQAGTVPENLDAIKAIILKDLLIEDADLSVRSYNVLKRAGLNTLGAVANLTVEQLERIRNLGRKSLQEIVAVLHKHGLHLAGEVD